MPKESKIASFVKRVAGQEEVHEIFEGQRVIKSDADSKRAGFEYGLEALGARVARGDEIEQWERDIQITKARELGIKNPESFVDTMIHSYQVSTAIIDDID